MGILTWDRIQVLEKKLEVIEKHLVSLEEKIDTISKENNSIKGLEEKMIEIRNQVFELKK
ncbi:MAG: hypothetical protein Q8936_13160 [Bacillota bacterium]|nr:hypothetical protein [Bacillota bacterium]